MSEFTKMELGLKRPDPALSFRWAVTSSLPFADQFRIDHSYVESVQLPFNNVQADTIFNSGGYETFPLWHSIDAITLNLYGDSEGRVLKWLMFWKSKVKDFKTGFYGLPIEYKRDLTVSLFDTTGKAYAKHKLIGIWPADTGNIDLQYTSSDRIIFSQNFAVDDMEIV